MFYKRKRQSAIENILIIVGRAIWSLVVFIWNKIFKKSKPKFDKVGNLSKWREIEQLLESNDEIHAEQAVVKADKFFDAMLKIAGGRGETFADRLRSLEDKFNHQIYQDIWQAHKLRNQISHEQDHKSTISECQSALRNFRRGLENLGAL